MGHEPSFDADRNVLVVGERRIVFHCHHYNVFLQRSIEDMLGEDGGAVELQVAAATESAREMLSRVLAGSLGSSDERLATAAAVFAQNGFGAADLSGFGAFGGVVRLPTSHYAIGWRAKWGASKRAVCHFATGFWAGALAAAGGLAPERIVSVEEQCAATGADACLVRVEVR